MSRFAQVKDLVLSLESDFEKFYDKGNQAAGTRVRGGLQQLKTLSQEIRTEVQNQTRALSGRRMEVSLLSIAWISRW